MSRSYVFTLNNYTEEEVESIKQIPARYIIFGREIGEKGTPHLQGYIEMGKPCRIAAMSKLINRAHFEKRMGTRDQARDYCKKQGDFIEVGDWGAGGQGTRNDLKHIMSLVKEGKKTLDIMEEAPETYSRNIRFIEKYKSEVEKAETREFRKIDVEVLWGDAGTGKTRKCFEADPEAFTVNADEAFPFDGYDGEKTIILDDFYGGLKYHFLLRVLDGHQLRINVKGSHRYAKWTKVYITSNKKPEDWYNFGMTPALARRIGSVTEFRNEETGNSETVSSELYDMLCNL